MDFVGMPVLQVLLLAIVFLGLLVEIKTGGLGAGALLGLVAAGVFFGSQYVKGLVSFYQIAVFLGGPILGQRDFQPVAQPGERAAQIVRDNRKKLIFTGIDRLQLRMFFLKQKILLPHLLLHAAHRQMRGDSR